VFTVALPDDRLLPPPYPFGHERPGTVAHVGRRDVAAGVDRVVAAVDAWTIAAVMAARVVAALGV